MTTAFNGAADAASVPSGTDDAAEPGRTETGAARRRVLARLARFVLAYPALLVAFALSLLLASGLSLALPAAFRLVVDCGFGAAAAGVAVGASAACSTAAQGGDPSA